MQAKKLIDNSFMTESDGVTIAQIKDALKPLGFKQGAIWARSHSPMDTGSGHEQIATKKAEIIRVLSGLGIDISNEYTDWKSIRVGKSYIAFGLDSVNGRLPGYSNSVFKFNFNATPVKEARDMFGDREFQTYHGWRRAVKQKHADAKFYGDRDIAGASAVVNGKEVQVAEWDGVKGSIFSANPVKEAIDGPSFEEVMDKFMALSIDDRMKIRQAARQSLRDRGADEIGSSDVNHEIVALYRQVGNFDDIPSEVGFSSFG